MQEFLMQTAGIIIGTLIVAFMAGILWVVRSVHGLLYKATNGDDDSLTAILTGIARDQKESTAAQQETAHELKKHHKWALGWAGEERKRRGGAP